MSSKYQQLATTLANRVSRIYAAVQRDGSRRISNPYQLEEYLREEMSGSTAGVQVTEGNALRVSSVFACVRLLSDAMAILPAGLYSKKGDAHTIAEDHPVHLLLAVAPNPVMSPYEFVRMAMAHVLLRGNFFARKVRMGNRVDALLPLNPARTKAVLDEQFKLTYEFEQQNGQVQRFTQDEILHIRGLCVDGVNGLSVLGAARNAIGLSIQTEAHGSRLFANGARPGGVLQHPATLSKEAVARLRDQVVDSTSGENQHKPLILEEGMTWQSVSLTAEDSQFIESRKFSRSEIAMFFGVPPHMIGDLESGTSWGSGIEQQNLGFLVYTLLSYVVNFQQALRRDLLGSAERVNFIPKFDTSLLTRADFLNRQNGLSVMANNGVLNADEWRKIEGLDPIGTEESRRYRSAPAQAPAGQGSGGSSPADQRQAKAA